MQRPVVAILQARMGSTRLPGKVLAEVRGTPLLEYMLQRVRRFDALDAVVVATTDLERDDPVAALAERLGLPVFRGSEADVLSRFAGAAELAGAGTIVRLTADCPLLVPESVESVLDALERTGADLATNAPPAGRTWPDGLDAEAFPRAALDRLNATTTDPADREHVTRGLHEDPACRVEVVDLDEDLGEVRITVDTAEDLEVVRGLLDALADRPDFRLDDLLPLVRPRRAA